MSLHLLPSTLWPSCLSSCVVCSVSPQIDFLGVQNDFIFLWVEGQGKHKVFLLLYRFNWHSSLKKINIWSSFQLREQKQWLNIKHWGISLRLISILHFIYFKIRLLKLLAHSCHAPFWRPKKNLLKTYNLASHFINHFFSFIEI